jgi:hypothetical protein
LHLAILVLGLPFAAFHLDLRGHIPRAFLGMVFGYIVRLCIYIHEIRPQHSDPISGSWDERLHSNSSSPVSHLNQDTPSFYLNKGFHFIERNILFLRLYEGFESLYRL